MNAIKIKSAGIYENSLNKLKKVEPLKIGDSSFQFEPQQLTPELIEKAKNELMETEENVTKALAEIRELLKGEPDLCVLDDDYFFAKYLRPCKWHAKPAFELMKRFYRYRINHPRICNNLLPSFNRDIFVSGVITPLPKRTEHGCRVVLIESGRRWDPKAVSLEQILRGVMILLEAAIKEPTTQVSGVHVILDMDGLSLSQVTYFTPSFASAVLEWVQKCLPTRIKGIHIINQPFIFNMVFAIFKPFFMEKLRKRLHFHGKNRQSLLSFVNAEALPCKYGGQLNFPDEPLGEVLWQYLCIFEDEYKEASNLGYINKE